MWLRERVWWVLLVLSAVRSETIFLELNVPSDDEISFMKRYGYLPEEAGGSDGPGYSLQAYSEAVSRVQAFAGLPQTGVVDHATQKLFMKKRCGVKDLYEGSKPGRARRYIIQRGWDIRNITYRVVNGARSLPRARAEALATRALAVWAPHGNLSFTRLSSGHADIMLSFAAGDHGDGFAFDGQGHVVAHAFPPPHGALHFDDDELWGEDVASDDEDDEMTDFFAVAVHELGHALGLSHSDVRGSVMFPYYKPGVERLDEDDVAGMRALYLKDTPTERVESTSEVAPRFTKADSEELEEEFYALPDLCMTNYDTLQVINGKIYVFEEEWVWVLSGPRQLEPGWPRRFHDVFRALPPRVTTVRTIYQKANGNVVIFKDRHFWEFDPSFRFIKRGNISKYNIPRKVSELSTVFISNYNNKTYLIEEDRFWRYDESTSRMDKGYPKDMSAWRKVPYPVDAAIIWEGDTFFFRGPRFWRFDNTLIQAQESYPLPVSLVWFNCTPSEELARFLVNDGP